ncbi:MlaD family protein [Salinisphaera sp. Q1T1-3]|uniref:MlaD family protein n=1 Tax=Salinisphaera sp. Q1T1-3 TaxID=2321229 RepID=UPI000E746673|nr:MlaD family protein [Salinisphaera sp. Q1T1-3]RJS94373.1 MCE family protein [Salinisphaera sp. Q1T1-3]
MASNRNYTVIGAFLLGAIILAAAGVLAFGNTGLFRQDRQAIIFFNQSVLGLTNGSRVLFRGVQVGTVKKVQLRLADSGQGARIAVTIDMSGDNLTMLNGQATSQDLTVDEMVQRGLRAQLVVYSYVTSQLAVNLDFRPDSQPNFVVDPSALDVPEIPAVPSQLDQLKDTVADLPWKQTMERVDHAMKTMVKLAEDMDSAVNTLTPTLNQTGESTQKTLAAVREAVSDNDKQLKQTLASVQRLTDTANDQIDNHDQQVAKILSNVQQTSASLAQMSRQLQNITAPDSGTRQDIQSTIRDLSATAASLRQFSETIERNPHALLYGKGSR